MDTRDAGRKGGQSKSEKKQAAARANGRRRKRTISVVPQPAVSVAKEDRNG